MIQPNNIKSTFLFFTAATLMLSSCGSSTLSKSSESTATSSVTRASSSEIKTTVKQVGTTSKTIRVDVRSVDEWNADGHADCSVNIPLPELEKRMEELKGYGKIVLVCRSGNRAGKAKDLLEAAGFSGVENLGAWQNIQCQ